MDHPILPRSCVDAAVGDWFPNRRHAADRNGYARIRLAGVGVLVDANDNRLVNVLDRAEERSTDVDQWNYFGDRRFIDLDSAWVRPAGRCRPDGWWNLKRPAISGRGGRPNLSARNGPSGALHYWYLTPFSMAKAFSDIS